jgi:hypothetical protein
VKNAEDVTTLSEQSNRKRMSSCFDVSGEMKCDMCETDVIAALFYDSSHRMKTRRKGSSVLVVAWHRQRHE